jgi:hypothetical protein
MMTKVARMACFNSHFESQAHCKKSIFVGNWMDIHLKSFLQLVQAIQETTNLKAQFKLFLSQS